MNVAWKGVFPACTTYFRKDLSLDLDTTAGHMEAMIDSGVSGFIMLGSLGENNAMSREEKLEVVKCAIGVSKGRVPVLSGVSELNTSVACEYVRAVEKLGADGFMVMPAMAYRADAEEAKAHFLGVARATGLPVIVYNNPIAYHVDLLPETLKQISGQENLVAVKESCGDPRRFTDLANALDGRYILFAGVDDLALECTMLGAQGWIAGIGLAFPKENQYLWELMMAGRWEEARELYRWYTPLLHLDVGVKFVQNIKLAIQECGLGTEWVRLPRLPLAGEERERVLKVIREGIANRPALPERTKV